MALSWRRVRIAGAGISVQGYYLTRGPVAELNGVPFGATCSSDSECGGAADSCCTGGKCSAAGWCSPKCQSDKDCPGGFFCIDHDGTRCFSACADDRDCPTDFICEDKNDHLTCRFKG